MNTTAALMPMPMAMASSSNPLCQQIDSLLLSPSYTILQYIQLCLLFSTLASTGFLFHRYNQHRITMHSNLLLLFANIVAVNFLHSLGHFLCILRYRVLMFFYTDECQLLTPFWLVAIFYGPTYFYYVAYPAFHFCVMLERLRATVLAERYEREHKGGGIAMVLVNWLLSLGFLAFVICAAVADIGSLDATQGIIMLTSKSNNLPIFYISIFTLFLVILTAFCDWLITKANNRIRAETSLTNRQHCHGYSLSRNYQLNENALAMRLILPVDTAYAILYALYSLLLILLRAYFPILGIVNFAYYYNLTNTLLFLYSAITMVVYIRFIQFVSQSRRQNVVTKRRANEPEARIYFRQLQSQWA